MFKRSFVCVASLLLPLVSGQDVPKPPTLTDVDVHVTPADYTGSMMTVRDTQLEMRGTTMLTMIQRAYGMDADRILGGPRRLEFDKYDVAAKLPPGTKTDAATINGMLKALLAERFKLVVR